MNIYLQNKNQINSDDEWILVAEIVKPFELALLVSRLASEGNFVVEQIASAISAAFSVAVAFGDTVETATIKEEF